MKTIKAGIIGHSTDETTGISKSGKSQSLRLEKQTIRTLSGAELNLAGGGACNGTSCCTCHSHGIIELA